MPLGPLSLVVASTLALSPFSTPLTVRAAEGGAWPTGTPQPADKGTPPASDTATPPPAATGTEPQPDPSWDEPADPTTPEPAAGTTGDPAGEVAPAPVTAPVLPPPGPAPIIIKPVASTGMGLMIAAGVTGGLGWVIALSKLAALNRCKSAIGTAVTGGSGGFDALRQCTNSTGSMLALTVPGWIVNDVTYGLAPAAGVYRGRYDGTNAAWEGKPQRPVPVFIGLGAGLLAGGIVGRVATFVAFWRQLSIRRALDGNIPFDKYPLGAHFVLQQVAAASIQAGGGLLGYGLAYKKAKTTEDSRRKAAGLANVKLAPQLGWAYTGLALTGEF